MKRKEFLRKGLMGTGIFVATVSAGSVLKNKIDEIAELDINIGFNHLPVHTSKVVDNMVLHKAASRGHANHGWLESFHTFSFANYYNPDRMHFGALRVLNDDRVDPGKGFGRHPHDNMEIVSIPLEGDLEHKDSMGNIAVIRDGDIQVMSAGKGVYHSEMNRNKDQLTKFLQIWVIPNKRDVTPRYDQITLKVQERHNKLQQIVSPNKDDDGVWIHQNAWFHLGRFDNGVKEQYTIKRKGNGVYAFVLSGRFDVGGQTLDQKDGLGVWDIDTLTVEALEPNAEILLMDVPMTLA